MKNLFLFFVLTSGALCLGACNQGLNLGVSGDTRVDELSAQEAREACDSYHTYYDDQIPAKERKRVECTRHGVKKASDLGDLSLEDLREACAEARDACLSDPDEKGVKLDDSCDFNEESCEATVDALEPCLEAIVDATADEYASFECESITSKDAKPKIEAKDLEACYGIQKSCYDD